MLSTERLRELYSLAASDGTERTPSYTDRVLLHSLPDLSGQLSCTCYSSSEHMAVSDHRPVCADLELRAPGLMPPAPKPTRCELTLSRLSIEGLPEADYRPSLTKAESSAPEEIEAARDSMSRASLLSDAQSPADDAAGKKKKKKARRPLQEDQVHGMHVLLPLPSEASGSALAAVEGLLGEKSTRAADEGSARWARAVQTGLSASAQFDAPRPVHALLKLLDASGESLGQGVLAVLPPGASVAPAAAGGGAGGAVQAVASVRPGPFALELTVEGRLVGILRGDVEVGWR